MKPFSFLLILFLIVFSTCEKNPKETPECIKAKIETYSFCEKGGTVTQYSFQGQLVYVFYLGSCRGIDSSADVYNENCECIGILGGIAGNNIINNELFIGNAKLIKTIWSN